LIFAGAGIVRFGQSVRHESDPENTLCQRAQMQELVGPLRNNQRICVRVFHTAANQTQSNQVTDFGTVGRSRSPKETIPDFKDTAVLIFKPLDLYIAKLKDVLFTADLFNYAATGRFLCDPHQTSGV
jgi:hypothetical protein